MSPATRHADNRRTTARIALFMVVAVMTTLVLFSGGPIGAISFARQQTTPAPTIQFMNPDDDTSAEVSAVSDGSDQAYHLVAWVSSVPANARVEFKYQESGQQEITIGTATQLSRMPDTFELYWQLANMPEDGAYTLRAVLFSGTQQVGEDEQAITVNNTPPPPPPDPDTDVPNAVEIRYPVNGGSVGFFTNAGVTAAQIDVTASPDTETVTVYYTTSPPGTDPTWKECGSEDHPDDTNDGIRCVLAENDPPDSVRGIAAVAGDSDPLGLPDVDSGDAHRATGYTQDPFSLTLTPSTQQVNMETGETSFPCSAFIVARVFDQFGRRVVGANVDVHAAFPVDRLAFDDPGTTNDDSSPHKAPDQGGHSTEPEANCEGNPTAFDSASQQGEHEVGNEGDVKHIETAAAGTTESGEFRFRMASGGSGVTQITAWADEDGNDVFCAEEPNADASISWGQAAETTPTGLPAEQSTCPRPTDPTTGTTSPATESPTTTESPTSPPPTTPDDPRGCTVVGSDDGERLEGTDGDDIICGNGGDDTILGRGGNDILYGDGGSDTINGGPGNDEMHGGDESDSMRGGGSSDDMFGDADADSLRGGGGDDFMDGGAHIDNVNGRAGDDSVHGGGGPDTLTGGSGNDLLTGLGGKDVLKGGKNDDRLEGGNQADVLSGFAGNDRLFGQGGPDFMDGGNGRDVCRGGAGRDRDRKCER